MKRLAVARGLFGNRAGDGVRLKEEGVFLKSITTVYCYINFTAPAPEGCSSRADGRRHSPENYLFLVRGYIVNNTKVNNKLILAGLFG